MAICDACGGYMMQGICRECRDDYVDELERKVKELKDRIDELTLRESAGDNCGNDRD